LEEENAEKTEAPQNDNKSRKAKKKQKKKNIPLSEDESDHSVASGIHRGKSKSDDRKSQYARRKTRQTRESMRAPDLPTIPIHAVTHKFKQSNPPIRVAEEKSVEVGIKAHLYRASPSSLAVEYEFKSQKGTVHPSFAFIALTNPLDRAILSMTCLEG
jgi:hypothetical protein